MEAVRSAELRYPKRRVETKLRVGPTSKMQDNLFCSGQRQLPNRKVRCGAMRGRHAPGSPARHPLLVKLLCLADVSCFHLPLLDAKSRRQGQRLRSANRVRRPSSPKPCVSQLPRFAVNMPSLRFRRAADNGLSATRQKQEFSTSGIPLC